MATYCPITTTSRSTSVINGREVRPHNTDTLSIRSLEIPVRRRPSYARSYTDSLRCPEKALMLAVLEDAIRTLLGGGKERGISSRMLARSARAWLVSRDRRWPFSFVSICEALGFEPCGIRDTLLSQMGDENGWQRVSAPSDEDRHSR